MAKSREMVTNRAALKRFILAQVKIVRPGWKCTRVSEKVLDQIEGLVRHKIKESLRHQPSIGKTYKEFY